MRQINRKIDLIERQIRNRAGLDTAWSAIQREDGSFLCTHQKHEDMILSETELDALEEGLGMPVIRVCFAGRENHTAP